MCAGVNEPPPQTSGYSYCPHCSTKSSFTFLLVKGKQINTPAKFLHSTLLLTMNMFAQCFTSAWQEHITHTHNTNKEVCTECHWSHILMQESTHLVANLSSINFIRISSLQHLWCAATCNNMLSWDAFAVWLHNLVVIDGLELSWLYMEYVQEASAPLNTWANLKTHWKQC